MKDIYQDVGTIQEIKFRLWRWVGLIELHPENTVAKVIWSENPAGKSTPNDSKPSETEAICKRNQDWYQVSSG